MKEENHLSLPPEVREKIERKPAEARRKIEQVWSLLGYLRRDAPNVPDTDTAWADLAERLETAAATPARARSSVDRGPIRRNRRSMTIGAAALLIAMILSVWVWRQPVSVVVPAGVQQTVVLPDGSTAHLNSMSRLAYHRSFQGWPLVPDARRRVSLDGEAFFEIVHDGRPFVVETFNARVEVLGTAFNVRARQGRWEGETQVTLESGKVQVSAPERAEKPMVLSEAGQTARVGDRALTVTPARQHPQTLEKVLSWRKQGFVANQSLEAIMDEVERRYALSITVDEKMAGMDSVNVYYPRGTTAEQIIHDICLSQGCQYRSVSGGFFVFPVDSTLQGSGFRISGSGLEQP